MTNIFAEEVTITWNANTEADLAGYELHHGNQSRNYTMKDVVFGNITTHTIEIPNTGEYFFALKAFDTSGNASEFSDEISRFVLDTSGGVVPDIIPPTITSVKMNDDPTKVIVAFSEPVDISGATYSISSGISVFSAGTSDGVKTVTLTTSPHIENVSNTLNIVEIKDLASIPNVIDPNNSTTYLFVPSTLTPDETVDDFSVDTTGSYSVTDVRTTGGFGSFKYDASGERIQVVTGDNIGLKISQDVKSLGRGIFSIDFLPTVKHPKGGIFILRLVQDENNYYKLINTDGYGPGELMKYVNGVKVSSVPFGNEFSQNSNYAVVINFSSDQTTVEAFGESISISTDNNPIMVNRFEVGLEQQDAFFDNILYFEDETVDDFSVDTTDSYSVTDVWTAGGFGSFKYDASGERSQVVTGDNIGLKISQDVKSLGRGIFSIDFLPTVKHPKGGVFILRLVQDENNYYKLINTDGYGPGELMKYVNGVKVSSVPFANEFSQNSNYAVVINFSSDQTTVEAFGESISINTDNNPIIVNRFEVGLEQQDAFFDNILYSEDETVDDFSVDTTSSYLVADVWTVGGFGSFKYDASGEMIQVVTGDNIGLKISQDVKALERGTFSIDFLPTVKHPKGGVFILRLVQDENNYYKLINTDGYGPGELMKYVNGVKVSSVPFGNEFSQNSNYAVVINFSSDQTTVEAFGESIFISTDNNPIMVNRFEVELEQQDAFFDNIIYKD